MKEKIYTIPINDAVDAGAFCPFCLMYKRLEESAVSYAVGPAMMEPDFRQLTNEKGFCKKHMQQLHAESKALALALVLDTHLERVSGTLETDLKREKKGIIKKGSASKAEFVKLLEKVNSSCVICDNIEDTFARYFDTFLFMLKKDRDFWGKVLETEGFCMEHFSRLISLAAKEYSDSDFEKKILPVIDLQKRRIKEYNTHIKNFVKNFDYRNVNNKTDVPNEILLKTGQLLNGEFQPQEKKLNI